MDFSIDRTELVQALGITLGVVERRNAMPILGNVLLQAGEDLSVSATDLEVHVKRRCSARITGAGSATVPARKLHELVRELPSGEIRIRSLENEFVEVLSTRSRAKLVGLAAADFPGFSHGETKGACTLELPAKALQRLVDQTIFAVSTDDTRLHLGGVLLKVAGSVLQFVATDGHRLALCEHSLKKPVELEKGIILPRKGLGELRKLVDGLEDGVKLRILGNAVKVDAGAVELMMRLIDGEFPNYEQVIPKETRYSVSVDRDELLAALRRVSVVTSDRVRGVRFRLGPNVLEVSASSADFGEASEEIQLEFSGDEMSVGFNARYLTEALTVLPEGSRVLLGLSDDQSPGVLQTEDEDSFQYVVMPMRL